MSTPLDDAPPQPTVLVVDDSDICLEIAREALEADGNRVVTTSSPLGVNRLVAKERPDVIVVDVSMPAMRGDKLIELVRRHQSKPVPILLHSDRPVNELRELVRTSGASSYVEKTDDGAALARAVRIYTRRRH